MPPLAQGLPRDAPPGLGIAEGTVAAKGFGKELGHVGWGVQIWVQVLVDKDSAGGRGNEAVHRSSLSTRVLLSSGVKLQEFGDSKLEFSLQVIIKIYLSK